MTPHYPDLRTRLAGPPPKPPTLASSATVEEGLQQGLLHGTPREHRSPPARLSRLYPLAGRVDTGPATVSQVAMVSWLLPAWLLAGDPGGLPPVASPEAFHGILARDSSSRRPASTSLQVSRLWAPQWLLGFLPPYSSWSLGTRVANPSWPRWPPGTSPLYPIDALVSSFRDKGLEAVHPEFHLRLE